MTAPSSQQEFEQACQEALTLCACEGLRRTSRAVTASFQKSLRASGITPAQLPILVAAQLMGPVPVGPLATQLVIDRTTLTRNLSGLQDAGLVSVDQDVDRRVRLVAITPTGRRALRRALRARRTAQAQLETRFGSKRMRSLIEELAALTSVAAA